MFRMKRLLICAKFGKDLFNISKVIGRKKVAQFFDSQCIYWLPGHISDIRLIGFCIISLKSLIMKSRDFVLRCLFTVWWRDRLDWLRITSTICCREADNLDVLAIVLIMKKRFLQVEEVFRSFRTDICYSINYHDDADSETTGSDDRFQGVELEVADQTWTSGTYLTANSENLRSHPCKSNLYILEQHNEHQKHFTFEHRGVLPFVNSLHDDVTGWTDYIYKHYMLHSNRSNQWRHCAVNK